VNVELSSSCYIACFSSIAIVSACGDVEHNDVTGLTIHLGCHQQICRDKDAVPQVWEEVPPMKGYVT